MRRSWEIHGILDRLSRGWCLTSGAQQHLRHLNREATLLRRPPALASAQTLALQAFAARHLASPECPLTSLHIFHEMYR